MKIGDRIRARREELNMSQEELAFALGYKSRSSINKIENDASGLPQSKIAAIASALKTTPGYLMGWDKNGKVNEIVGLLRNASDEQIANIAHYIRFTLQDSENDV